MLRGSQEQAFGAYGGQRQSARRRLIAATHRDLKGWSRREVPPDLVLPAGAFTITCPPCGRRGDDLLMLVAVLPAALNRELGGSLEVAPEGLERLRWATRGRATVLALHSVMKQARSGQRPRPAPALAC